MMPAQPGDWPDQSRPSRRRDRSLTRVTAVTVVGGAGAVLATGALATWLSLPANAKPGVPAKKKPATGSVPAPASGQQNDPNGGGLRPPNQPPGRVNGKQRGSSAATTAPPPPPPPEVSSGGS